MYSRYFDVIGAPELMSASATMETLRAIIERHLSTFYYQNIELIEAGALPVSERKIPSLEMTELFNKMLDKKSGYCMQHSELLNDVLTHLGFQVDRFLAKGVVQPASKQLDARWFARPTSHEILVTHLDGKRYIVDVGMGNNSIREPLELKEGVQIIRDEMYRIVLAEDWLYLDVKNIDEDEGKWLRLLCIKNEPVTKQALHDAHVELYRTEQFMPIRDLYLLYAKTTLEKRKILKWEAVNQHGVFSSTRVTESNANVSIKPKDPIEFHNQEEVERFAAKKFGK